MPLVVVLIGRQELKVTAIGPLFYCYFRFILFFFFFSLFFLSLSVSFEVMCESFVR